ncbi:MAG: hypothetical protein ABFD91_03830 [Anaerohalosphaeraceae bacterium]
MICWYYKWKISKLADENGSVLSHDVAGHLKHCDHCRRFYHLCRGIERELDIEMPLPSKASMEVQHKVAQSLHSGSIGQKRLIIRRRHRWGVTAAILLLAIPAAVLWTISSDLTTMLQKEQASGIAVSSLPSLVNHQWIGENRQIVPSEYQITSPFRQQVQEITENGRQAARFMFACLDPGFRVEEEEANDDTPVVIDYTYLTTPRTN